MNVSLTQVLDLDRRRTTIQTKIEQWAAEQEALRLAVGEAKGRLDHQDDIQSVIEYLQKLEHHQAVGAYEQLLTALLEDVLPGERRAVLELGVEKNLPALDVYLQKGDGNPLESALDGTGGSVANLLSIGLRMIALIRSGRRRFMVLDEADCWLSPKWVPKLVQVIQGLSEKLGLQVLMISHHDDQLFEDLVEHRLQLYKEKNSLSVTWALGVDPPTWNDAATGIRSILLEDFQSHKTTLLPLGPGLTLLQGDNDIGKSAIVTALRAVYEGEGNDTVIRHGTPMAKVTQDFGHEGVLVWERYRKNKVKERYSYFNRKGEVIERSEGARQVPSWLTQQFGIGSINGFDVQIGHQKRPIFLLDETASRRAEALAIGSEGEHIQAIQSLHRKSIQLDRATVKNGEAKLEALFRCTRATVPFSHTKNPALVQAWEKLDQKNKHKTILQALLDRWQAFSGQATAVDPLKLSKTPTLPKPASSIEAKVLLNLWSSAIAQHQACLRIKEETAVKVPELGKAAALIQLRNRWNAYEAQKKAFIRIQDRSSLLAVPTFKSTALRQLQQKWRQQQQAMHVLDRLKSSTPPALIFQHDSQGVTLLLDRWKTAEHRHQECQDQVSKIIQEVEQHKAETPACPTCGKEW